MSHAMQGAGSIYFATLQGYVINEMELYNIVYIVDVCGDFGDIMVISIISVSLRIR